MKGNIFKGIMAGVMALGGLTAGAAPIFEDDFEDYTSTSGLAPWTIEGEFEQLSSGKTPTKYTWVSAGNGLSGKRSVQGGNSDFNGDGNYFVTLVTPELTLPAGKSYKVDFLWQLSTSATITNHCNDLLVQLREPGGQWTTVFAADDPELCAASGVLYPWGLSGNWEINHSIVDISAFAGKKVQVGFTWNKKEFDKGYANFTTIDDVVIEEYTPANGPVASLDITRYSFPATYVGTISNSEVVTLTNTGKGTLKIKSIEGLDGTDFVCTLDPAKVSIDPNYAVMFNVRYIPTVNGAASATMKINIEGGEGAEIALFGSKKPVPDNYNVENFESEAFPPVGWSKTGNWNSLASSFSGDRCTYVNLTMTPAVHTLVSPRLDLSGADNWVAFSYINQPAYYGDDMYGVENYVELDLSTDGGKTWTNKWSLNDYVENVTVEQVDLGPNLGDDCLVRWTYYIPDLDPTIYDYEYSNFFLDAVVLPPFAGQGGKPAATVALNPKDEAANVVNNGLILSWEPALFATGYKLYLGNAPEAFNLVNGTLVEATSYAAPRLDYDMKYYWKVVPTNAAGDAVDAPVWSFTTMADQSIRQYPYSQGFEEADNELPLGWATSASGSTKWGISKIGAFDGKQIAFASGTTSNTEAILTTPEIILPSDDPVMLSFFWGNNAPATLNIDATGSAKNTTKNFDGNDGCYLEVKEADGDWKQLALISEDSQYWVREAISLAPYAGKIVQLRWRYSLEYGNGRRGISLDNIVLQGEKDAAPAYFNVTEFNFGQINAGRNGSSKKAVTLTNGGLSPVKITSLEYGDARFSSDLAEGQTLESNKAVPVTIVFEAGNKAEEVEGLLKVNFEGGKSVSLPLYAEALPQTTLYFNFEDDEHGSLQPAGLTTIDVDRQPSVMSSVITNYPHRGAATAFIVLNVTREYADWRNVYPNSGDQVLAAFRTQSEFTTADDWIISPKMKATDKSQFRFFGKSYGTTDEFNDFLHHNFEVYVSTTGANVADFKDQVKKKTELAYSAEGKFTEYTIDLSKYDGQEIFVGLRHTAPNQAYVAFFDDFYYENFENFDLSGITIVTGDDSDALYYDLNGLPVDMTNAAPGIYVRVSGSQVSKVLVR